MQVLVCKCVGIFYVGHSFVIGVVPPRLDMEVASSSSPGVSIVIDAPASFVLRPNMFVSFIW